MGLWLVLFLLEHLLTNSQAALWIGDDGSEFVKMVQFIHNLPYLEVIEIALIGVPILIHGWWGVKYALTAKFNNTKTDGSTPYLPLRRNHAYTWMRITSWILLIGIVLHVAKFRFLDYPTKVQVGNQTFYLIEVSMDNGLSSVAFRLNATLYDAVSIGKMQSSHDNLSSALEKQKVGNGNVIACCKEFGTASLLAVRNTFKSPIYIVFYTIFVIAACFHAGNGVWSFLITWGWILKYAAQQAWVTVTTVLIGILLFLGLIAIWGTYWLNLRT